MKKKPFKIPGLFHPITVKLLKPEEMSGDEDEFLMGYYYHNDCVIELSNELSPEVRRHTLFHEIGHHIVDTLDEIKDDEAKANILATYIIALIDARKNINKILK